MTKTELGANTQVWLSSASKDGIKEGRHYGSDMQMLVLKDVDQDEKKATGGLWEKT